MTLGHKKSLDNENLIKWTVYTLKSFGILVMFPENCHD